MKAKYKAMLLVVCFDEDTGRPYHAAPASSFRFLTRNGKRGHFLTDTPEAYHATVEAMANAHYRSKAKDLKARGYTSTCYALAEKMLAALGIKRPQASVQKEKL